MLIGVESASAARDRLAFVLHLLRVRAHARRALLGHVLERRCGRHAADRSDKIGRGKFQIGHHRQIDRRSSRQARRVEPDRDQPGTGRSDFAPAVAEIEQHVGLAREAHGAQDVPMNSGCRVGNGFDQ